MKAEEINIEIIEDEKIQEVPNAEEIRKIEKKEKEKEKEKEEKVQNIQEKEKEKEKENDIMSKVKLCLVTYEDAEQIDEIHRGLMKNNGFPPDLYYNWISQGFSYLYRIDDLIVAYCLTSIKDENTAYFPLIMVRKEYQRKGLATKLIKYCIDNCAKNGYSNFSIHTMTTNAPAISLYEKLGFVKTRTIPNMYPDFAPGNRDAYMMDLTVDVPESNKKANINTIKTQETPGYPEDYQNYQEFPNNYEEDYYADDYGQDYGENINEANNDYQYDYGETPYGDELEGNYEEVYQTPYGDEYEGNYEEDYQTPYGDEYEGNYEEDYQTPYGDEYEGNYEDYYPIPYGDEFGGNYEEDNYQPPYGDEFGGNYEDYYGDDYENYPEDYENYYGPVNPEELQDFLENEFSSESEDESKQKPKEA